MAMCVPSIGVWKGTFNGVQVIKTFSKNVEGCRDGSAKNHRN